MWENYKEAKTEFMGYLKNLIFNFLKLENIFSLKVFLKGLKMVKSIIR